jgi:Mg-chelatase subunit ChlD
MNTEITFVLDSSGSMDVIKDDIISGFNGFLDDQRADDGVATVTLYEFDAHVECVFRGRPLKDAPRLSEGTYVPGGSTALHDAIYTAVTETDSRVSEADTTPDNVVIVVFTDGKENASETPRDRVREEVKSRRRELGWEFLFIGANQDAALTAETMGMTRDRSLRMAHSGEGARAAFESTSEQVRNVRREGRTDGFTDADRRRQEDASE